MHTKTLNFLKRTSENAVYVLNHVCDSKHKTEWQFKDITEFHFKNECIKKKQDKPLHSVTTKHLSSSTSFNETILSSEIEHSTYVNGKCRHEFRPLIRLELLLRPENPCID